MKRKLLKTKLFKVTLVVMGLLFAGTIFAQTTILNGQTITASSIGANTAVIINAGGTLNMDATRSFSNITTANAGTSTISGTGDLTVNSTITLAANSTLSVAPQVTAQNLVTTLDDNQTATLSGAGQISATNVTINAGSGDDATLSISNGFTLQVVTAVTGAGGNGTTNHILTTNGIFKISGTLNGIDDFNCNAGSTVEYNGGNNQAVLDVTYDNLTLAGTGAKTFSGDRDIDGNFLLEAGASLSLGGNTLTMNSNNAKTATINGTLNINGDGRVLKMNTANKTLVLGSQGVLNLTDAASGNGLEMPLFGTYTFAAASTVNYGAADDQIIADILAPGYGNLVVSGASGTKTAAEALDIQRNFTLTSSTFDAGNFTHNLKGNWEKNGGTFTAGSNNNSRISFTGSAAQTIGGSQAAGTTFRNITFANTAGGITLTKPTTVTANVTFTNGVITSTATNVLIFNNDATSSLLASNATTTSYVSGPVRKVGNDAFVFPIGGATGFVPLSISAPDNNADAFTAQYIRAVPTEKTDITAAGINNISTCDYWDLAETNDAGTANTINATFYWNANNPCNGAGNYVTDATKIKAVHYTGGSWSAASTGVGAGSAAAGSVIFAGLTTFSPFALGSITDEDNPLPVVFGDVKAYEKNGSVHVEWSNLTEKDVAEYAIERSANGKDFTAIAKQWPTSNQNDKATYTGFDAVPATGANYYRIKAVETTGKIVYSKILSVNLGKANFGLQLYPNPVIGNQVTVSLSNIKHGKYNIRVVNTSGQDIFKQIINNQSDRMTQILDLPSSVKPGVYNMIITGDNYRETKIFIVQ
jgi:hypothetical protein